MRIYFLLYFVILFVKAVPASENNKGTGCQNSTNFIKGADVSFIPQIEDNGGIYQDEGIQTDPLKIFTDHGFNFIRLKLWHTPEENYNNLEKIFLMAKRIKEQGCGFLLNFHYSDTWADPGHQTKPAAWQNISFQALKDSVYDYTKRVIRSLCEQGAAPEMVQIGNEINSGMLWNDGRVGGNYNSNWGNFAALVNEAISGVRESCQAGDSIKIMIHIAGAGNNSGNRWFFDNLFSRGVNFDIIGLSYYPWWHGTLSQVRNNLNDLAHRYKKDIIIVETAYPWTLQWFDAKHNKVGNQSQLHEGYPASVNGQASFLRDLMQILRQTRDGRGKGIFYWAPEYISAPPLLSSWENNTLFDFYGNSLNSMDVFLEEPDTLNPINVRMIVNTSTHWDTVDTHHFVQIRGDVQGASYLTLPDGKKISWDANSDLVLVNIGGDYWEVEFQAYPGDILSYKIWTGYTRDKGTSRRVGWEGPIISVGASNENTRILEASQQDTLLPVQYYNSESESKDQYWQPFTHKEDSIALYFKVNMGGVMNSGRFNPDSNGPVGIRGERTESGGVFDWDSTKIILQREENSVNNGSFWSGICYIHKNEIQAGTKLSYKFFIENDTQNGWENNVPDHELLFTNSLIEQNKDTTLHWVYFDNFSPFTGLETQAVNKELQFSLKQNFPNPFNNQTRIHYNIMQQDHVSIFIFNLQGQLITRLVDGIKNRGAYSCLWNGKDLSGVDVSTGIYLINMKTKDSISVRKTLLMR
ncbi:glycosyl hydrolase 53 family protein [candidate division KSB1 bacterium]|nr:glycosyl hydrolase 53 family protein [candidate division KSB1 bacterium]